MINLSLTRWVDDYFSCSSFCAFYISLKQVTSVVCLTCGNNHVYVGHKVYWAPNAFNNLATVFVWAVWCVLEGQTHAASTLPVQQLSKQAVRFHMEGPLFLDPHWSGQAWKPPLSQSGGIWGANATLRRRNLCDSGKQLTAHFASSALLLFSVSLSLSFPPFGFRSTFSVLNCMN